MKPKIKFMISGDFLDPKRRSPTDFEDRVRSFVLSK